jgi:hypothetical protein
MVGDDEGSWLIWINWPPFLDGFGVRARAISSDDELAFVIGHGIIHCIHGYARCRPARTSWSAIDSEVGRFLPARLAKTRLHPDAAANDLRQRPRKMRASWLRFRRLLIAEAEGTKTWWRRTRVGAGLAMRRRPSPSCCIHTSSRKRITHCCLWGSWWIFHKASIEAGMTDLLKMTDRLMPELGTMLAEHKEIVGALAKLIRAAEAENKPGDAHFTEKLMLHGQTEEQLLYPAAILVGEIVRSKLVK